MSEVVFHRLDRDRVLAALQRWAREELARQPEVRSATLIGSLARGDHSARSDADVVLLVDEARGQGSSRGAAYLPRQPVGIPLDILVFTAPEMSACSPAFRDEVRRGVPLLLG